MSYCVPRECWLGLLEKIEALEVAKDNLDEVSENYNQLMVEEYRRVEAATKNHNEIVNQLKRKLQVIIADARVKDADAAFIADLEHAHHYLESYVIEPEPHEQCSELLDNEILLEDLVSSDVEYLAAADPDPDTSG